MIVEYIRYKLEPHAADVLIEAYTQAGEQLKAAPECLGFELTRCSESPETFILRILWDSADGHMKAFRARPEFGAFLQAIKPFIPNIEEMRHYDLTAVRWSR